MAELQNMDRKAMVAFIKENNLKVKVFKRDTDDEIRKKVDYALTGTTAKSEQDLKDDKAIPKDKVVYRCKYPKQWIGDLQFQSGLLELSVDDEERIKLVEDNSKFGHIIQKL